MDVWTKLVTIIESALRHADMPDNLPWVDGVIAQPGQPNVIGVRLSDGSKFVVRIEPA